MNDGLVCMCVPGVGEMQISGQAPQSASSQYKFFFNIGSVESFERKLEEAQDLLGLEPREYVPVRIRRGWRVSEWPFGKPRTDHVSIEGSLGEPLLNYDEEPPGGLACASFGLSRGSFY